MVKSWSISYWSADETGRQIAGNMTTLFFGQLHQSLCQGLIGSLEATLGPNLSLRLMPGFPLHQLNQCHVWQSDTLRTRQTRLSSEAGFLFCFSLSQVDSRSAAEGAYYL